MRGRDSPTPRLRPTQNEQTVLKRAVFFNSLDAVKVIVEKAAVKVDDSTIEYARRWIGGDDSKVVEYLVSKQEQQRRHLEELRREATEAYAWMKKYGMRGFQFVDCPPEE